MGIKKKSSEALHRSKNQLEQTFATPEQFDLWQKMKAGDSEAENKLIKLNTGLIRRHAMPYENEHYYDDLLQVGRIALSESLRKFNPFLGNRFSTYSFHWINELVVREANKNLRGLKIPIEKRKELRNLVKTENSLTLSLGRQPTEAEIVENSIFSLDDINLLRSIDDSGGRYPSLNQLIRGQNFESNSTLEDLLFDKDQLTPEELAIESIHRQEIRKAMEKLPKIQLGVVLGRNGFIKGLTREWQELADEFGVSIGDITKTIGPLSNMNMKLLIEYYSTNPEIWQNLANCCNLTPFRAMLHCHFLDSLTKSSSENLPIDQIVNRIEILNLVLEEDLDEERRQVVILLNGLGEQVPISSPEIRAEGRLNATASFMSSARRKANKAIIQRLKAEN